MDSAELYPWLVEATLATSVATLAVLTLRKPLRVAFGAAASHASWSVVPVALLATLLPAAEAEAPTVPLAVIRAPIRMLAAEVPRSTMPEIATWACVAWLCGCVAFAAFLSWQQRRFVRGLGGIADRGDGLLLADAVAGLPAVVGVWKPRIVMPADAMNRYDTAERALMLAHEREHIARGDLLANAGVAALRCLFWFNPLLHFAARRFRDDQELACDARVIARHPQSRRAYGEAMLKTQMAAVMLPLGCHWGQSHPLKERIEMLKQPLPSSMRRAGGRAIVIAILLATGYTAWAAQPAGASPGDHAGAVSARDAGASAESAEANAASPAADSNKAPQASIDNASRMLNPPVYPVDVQKQGVTGMVVLVVDVSTDGSVSGARVDRSAGDQRLDAAALDAVKQWKFLPATKDGKPVASQVRVPVDFRVDDEPGTPVATARATSGRAQVVAWNSYEQLVGSLSASWEEPAPPGDDC